MNAIRKFRMLALVALVAVLLVGIAGTSADAGCYGYKTFYTPSYHHVNYHVGYQPYYYPTYNCYTPYYFNSCYNAYPVTYLP